MVQTESKYLALGRNIEGVSVKGYALLDKTTGYVSMVDRQTVEKLAINKQVENMTAQLYDGKILIKGLNCRLSELPNYDSDGKQTNKSQKSTESKDKIVITGRILQGKNIIGYTLSLLNNGRTSGEKRMKREDVVKMARNGLIANARVQMSNGKYVLRGVNCELAKLPSTSI